MKRGSATVALALFLAGCSPQEPATPTPTTPQAESSNGSAADTSPILIDLAVRKVADLQAGAGTDGIQIVNGRLFGHSIIDPSTGASQVYSVNLDGTDYRVEVELPGQETTDNPPKAGLAIAQEAIDSNPYLVATRSPQDPQVILNGNTPVIGSALASLPFMQPSFTNNCLDTIASAENFGWTYNVDEDFEGLTRYSVNTQESDSYDILVSQGETSSADAALGGISSCSFAGKFLLTSFSTENGFLRNAAENATLSFNMKDEAGDLRSAYLARLTGDANMDASVSAIATDVNDPHTLYFTIDGEDALYIADMPMTTPEQSRWDALMADR